jgi:Domain of unknown function (DUF6458)
MRTGAGLALICLGAILAFAVTGNVSFFNVHTAGWVIMLVGVAGLVMPRRTYGWLGRRMRVRRTYPGGVIEEGSAPPFVTRKPGMWRVTPGLPARPTLLDDPAADLIDAAAEGRAAGDPIVEAPRGGYGPPPDGTGAGAGTSVEVIEDVYEQP